MKSNQFPKPQLIVVTGRPASGKTTLAHALATEIRCPLISRDAIKEGLVNTFSKHTYNEIDINHHVYDTFFETIEFLISKNITLIAEAAFQHRLWVTKLEILRKLAQIKIIYCAIDTELAKSRFIERAMSDPERASFHDDWSPQPSKEIIDLLNRDYQAPNLDSPSLTVDTSEGYNPKFEEIVSFIKID